MDTKQQLLNDLIDAREEGRDDIVLRLYRIFTLEMEITTEKVVSPPEAVLKMGKWLREPYYFEMFRRRYPLPPGMIEYTDKPDFILRGVTKIGIEITNFFIEDGPHPQSEQRPRDKREEVVSRAQRIYLENGGKEIRLHFSFDKVLPIGDQPQQQELAERIAALASHIDRRETGQIGNDDFEHIPQLSFVYLLAEGYPDSQWKVRQGHKGSILSRGRLLEIVKKKESKARHYQHCDAYWLVLVIDFIDLAQDQEIRVNGFLKIESTIFERVLVYKTGYDHVLVARGPE